MLFFHRKLRCLVAVDLKIGEFKPEYAGKMNYYLSLLDLASKAKPPLAFSVGTGIFNPGTDKITFGGVVYGIRSIIPQDWQNNAPGAYMVILKNIAESEAAE